MPQLFWSVFLSSIFLNIYVQWIWPVKTLKFCLCSFSLTLHCTDKSTNHRFLILLYFTKCQNLGLYYMKVILLLYETQSWKLYCNGINASCAFYICEQPSTNQIWGLIFLKMLVKVLSKYCFVMTSKYFSLSTSSEVLYRCSLFPNAVFSALRTEHVCPICIGISCHVTEWYITGMQTVSSRKVI